MKRIITFSEEEKKIHNIILSANFLKNLGIDGGKMGAAIYLLNKCRTTPNSVYEDLAFELLEEIDQSVCKLSIVDFRYGLCGIGWGFEHLVKNRFLETETDLCISFEDKIWTAFQQEEWEGIKGIKKLMDYLLYFLARIESSMVGTDSEQMCNNKSYVINAVDKLNKLIKEDILSQLLIEKNNNIYGTHVPLVLSYWEYPLLLWILKRIWVHRLDTQKTEALLLRLIEEFILQDLLPKQKNNKVLLNEILQDLIKMELRYSNLNMQAKIFAILGRLY